MILSGVLTGILVYGVVTGALKTPIYTDVAEYGWAYTLGMTVVLFVMTDCINYWCTARCTSSFCSNTCTASLLSQESQSSLT